MKRKSARIVVDASVMKAAGETEHPVSSSCRSILLAIQDICHRVVISPSIRKEWKTHYSSFSRRWHASMVGKKKVVPIEDTPFLNPPETGLSGSEVRALAKDACYLTAASTADKVLVLLDKGIQDLCGKHREILALPELTWINPSVIDPAAAEEMLKALLRPSRKSKSLPRRQEP